MKIEIRSRKLNRALTFTAHDVSGYVRVGDENSFATTQLFDRHGDAVVARTEEALRRAASAWIKRQQPVA